MDASDIWLTCAPESEKPTTVCGWARQRLIAIVVERRRTSARRAGACRSRARAGSSTRRGAHPARRRRFRDRRVRRQWRGEHLHPVELRRAGLAAERLGVRTLVGDLHEPCDDIGVFESAPLLLDGQGTQLPPLGQAVEGQLRAERREGADAAADG